MAQVWRIMVGTLGRLNLWIAALLLLGLLQDPQVALQNRSAPQISAQPVTLLAAAPKFTLGKPASAETRARLITLFGAGQAVLPPLPSGFRLLHRAVLPSLPQPLRWLGWQARAPPNPLANPLI